MRFLLLFFSGLMCCFVLQAEPAVPPSEPENQMYPQQSIDKVATLNKVADVLSDPLKNLKSNPEEKTQLPLRDPTQMSGNFRQELKKISTAGSNTINLNNPSPKPVIPAIELAAKIMGRNKSVLLKMNNRTVQVSEGGEISLIDGQQLITVRVDKIDKNQVKIFLLPLNEYLILQ